MGFFWEPAALQIHVHVSDAKMVSDDDEEEEEEAVFIAVTCFHTFQKVKN